MNDFTMSILPAFFAYLDPGTGSYIFQIMIAALFGALITLKTFWGKIIKLFTKIFKR